MENNTGAAIASMVIGIVAVAGFFVLNLPGLLVLILAAVGLFLAATGLKQCPAGRDGHGMAVAGLVLNVVALALVAACMLCVCAGCAVSAGAVGLLALL